MEQNLSRDPSFINNDDSNLHPFKTSSSTSLQLNPQLNEMNHKINQNSNTKHRAFGLSKLFKKTNDLPSYNSRAKSTTTNTSASTQASPNTFTHTITRSHSNPNLNGNNGNINNINSGDENMLIDNNNPLSSPSLLEMQTNSPNSINANSDLNIHGNNHNHTHTQHTHTHTNNKTNNTKNKNNYPHYMSQRNPSFQKSSFRPRKIDIGLLLGDPFALSTFSVCTIGWIVAFVGSIIRDSSDAYPPYNWWRLVYELLIIVAVGYIFVTDEGAGPYKLVFIGFLSVACNYTTDATNAVIYTSSSSSNAASAGFILMSICNFLWLIYFGTHPSAPIRRLVDSYALRREVLLGSGNHITRNNNSGKNKNNRLSASYYEKSPHLYDPVAFNSDIDRINSMNNSHLNNGYNGSSTIGSQTIRNSDLNNSHQHNFFNSDSSHDSNKYYSPTSYLPEENYRTSTYRDLTARYPSSVIGNSNSSANIDLNDSVTPFENTGTDHLGLQQHLNNEEHPFSDHAASLLTSSNDNQNNVIEIKHNSNISHQSITDINDLNNIDDHRTSLSSPSSYNFKAQAIYDYSASADDANELSFDKGEILEIVDISGRWWQARRANGETGICPSNYVQLLT